MAAPGTALTSQFLFGQASLLVGPMADQLILNAAAHSLGLVKNVNISSETQRADLTQGVLNEPVATVVNGLNITGATEVYEFTAKNLAYGLSLDGSALTPMTSLHTLQATVNAAATAAIIPGVDVTAQYPANSWIFLQEGQDDRVHIARVSTSAFSTNTTVNFVGYPVPTGMTFTTTAGRIGRLNKVDTDPVGMNTNFSMRVVGTSLTDKRPIVLHFPKVRITKGFSMAFSADNYGNLPFEFMPLTPVATDAGYNAQFPYRMSVLTP